MPLEKKLSTPLKLTAYTQTQKSCMIKFDLIKIILCSYSFEDELDFVEYL